MADGTFAKAGLDRSCFQEVVASVAKDLEQLVSVLRATLVQEHQNTGRTLFSENSFLELQKYSTMIHPLASTPFTPSRPRGSASPRDMHDRPALPALPDCALQVNLPVEIPEAEKSEKSDSTNHFQSETEEFDSAPPTVGVDQVVAERWRANLHSSWSECDTQVLDEYIEHVKRKPTLGRQPSSLGNFFGIDFQKNSQSSLSLHLILSSMRWVVSPLSAWRVLWDIASMVFLLYDVLAVPLQVFDIPDSDGIQVVEAFCRLFWMGDIVMSFRTGFYKGPALVMRASDIAKNYLRTWFSLDIIIIIADWLKSFVDIATFNSMQVIRLARLYKLARYRRIVLDRSNSNHVHLYLDCIDVAVWCAIAIHLISCGWYWLGERANGWTREDHMQGADLFYSYFAAARWTIAQLSGRTDIELRTTVEYIYTCCACVSGLIIMSLMVSTITNTMIELGTLNRDRSSKSRALNGFLKYNHVGSSLAFRAKAVLVTQQKMFENSSKEQEVLALLPRQINSDLLYEIRAPLLTEHILFADLGKEFPRMLRRVCADAVKALFVFEDELAFARGDACTRMFFVASGSLKYTWKAGKGESSARLGRMSERLDAGMPGELFFGAGSGGSEHRLSTINGVDEQIIRQKQWLSEAALWVEWEHRGDLRGCELSSLSALGVDEFISVVKLFRWARARSVIYARDFVETLKSSAKWSDVMEPNTTYFFGTRGRSYSDTEVVNQTQEDS